MFAIAGFPVYTECLPYHCVHTGKHQLSCLLHSTQLKITCALLDAIRKRQISITTLFSHDVLLTVLEGRSESVDLGGDGSKRPSKDCKQSTYQAEDPPRLQCGISRLQFDIRLSIIKSINVNCIFYSLYLCIYSC